MEMRGASALVTGAGRGIGRAVALHLAREGAKVAVVARSASELGALVAEIRGAGGTGRLAVLVNNAGVGALSPLADTTDDTWDRVIGTNLTAVFRLTRAALPHLTQGGGHVFMVSSLAGSNAIAGMSAYCASKAALDHLSACLMLEVRGAGVKVTVLAPGSVDTTFAGMPRSGETGWMLRPDDVATAIVDLLKGRDGAHLSRVEMRPAQPQKRG